MGIPPGIGGRTRTHTQDLPTPRAWVQVSAAGKEKCTHTHTRDLPTPGARVWVSATGREIRTRGMTHGGSYPRVQSRNDGVGGKSAQSPDGAHEHAMSKNRAWRPIGPCYNLLWKMPVHQSFSLNTDVLLT